jgi:hypothetical protein
VRNSGKWSYYPFALFNNSKFCQLVLRINEQGNSVRAANTEFNCKTVVPSVDFPAYSNSTAQLVDVATTNFGHSATN